MPDTVLLIEPYYAGSHKVLMDLLHEELSSGNISKCLKLTMTGKKWHWRARTSSLFFAQNIPIGMKDIKCIFASCVLPLHELLGLRPDLQQCKKIVYFHENQLIYPVRKSKERDFQYGYNQIMTCLAADVIIFNSQFNMTSFLENLNAFFKLQPDNRPKNLREQIEPKCKVLYFPLKLSPFTSLPCSSNEILTIVWPHRWEHDKNPDMFFRVCTRLKELGKLNFKINVLGETFTDNPPIFQEAQNSLANHITHFGYVTEKPEYFKLLQESDIVLSTANHEFFGVAMLEGVHYKCFPLAPNDLVYPEIFPFSQCLYKCEEDLINKLINYLDNVSLFYEQRDLFFQEFSMEKFTWSNLKETYMNVLLQ